MTKIKFSNEAQEMLKFLKKESINSKKERMILTSISQKIEFIKLNEYYGDQIRKNLIPEFYRKKYFASNLFLVELPQFWRMLYTITDDKEEIEIIAFIIDVLDHKEYNKKFKYRKK